MHSCALIRIHDLNTILWIHLLQARYIHANGRILIGLGQERHGLHPGRVPSNQAVLYSVNCKDGIAASQCWIIKETSSTNHVQQAGWICMNKVQQTMIWIHMLLAIFQFCVGVNSYPHIWLHTKNHDFFLYPGMDLHECFPFIKHTRTLAVSYSLMDKDKDTLTSDATFRKYKLEAMCKRTLPMTRLSSCCCFLDFQ